MMSTRNDDHQAVDAVTFFCPRATFAIEAVADGKLRETSTAKVKIVFVSR
jgi:hypothetical protein